MKMYKCQCGELLKEVKRPKKPIPLISYKVLIVKTERHYKCPNGCELQVIKTIN